MISRTAGTLAPLVMLAALAAGPAAAQNDATDRLGVPGPIAFEGTDYALAWTSQPSDSYFKQEYVPAGQQPQSYTDMFMVEAVTSGVTVENAVLAQIGMLDQRQGSDPVVNYDIIRNDATGEIILDFLVSDLNADPIVIEWNAYRYASLEDGDGVALYAISRRGYGDEARTFLEGLGGWRMATINALAQLDVPAVTPQP